MNLSLLSNLSSAKILVVGDVMLDRYWQGDTGRISPEAPVPVVKISTIQDKVGGAANVAKNIAHLDGQVSLLGIIGDDEFGEQLKNILQTDNINAELITQTDSPTIAKMRVISRHQQVVRLDLEETFSETHSQLLLERLTDIATNFDVVVFSDYNKGSLKLIEQMIASVKALGKTVLIDPKGDDFSRYKGADFITPNFAEFKVAGGDATNEQSVTDSARQLLNKNKISNMLLTRSEKGMSLISLEQKHDFAAQVREVADVTGAGDTVIATLAMMLAIGMPANNAVEIANLAAGIVVGKLGAATVSPEELGHKLSEYLLENRGKQYRTPFSDVMQHIVFAKQNGERIVFTNGCFDILHSGHVRYLAQAKTLGDRLVVGLNSDDSIKRLKGENRPINNLDERTAILSGLASVDWVIPFGDDIAENDTPLKLIKQIKPDVLVKGGDYSVENIVGAQQVLGNGGTVKVLEFVEGRSTSNVIEKVKNS